MNVFIEREHGEYIGTIEHFWFVEDGKSEEEVICKLAESLKEFAIDYYKDFELYRNTSDFTSMFPKLKRVINSDINSIINTFVITVKNKRD